VTDLRFARGNRDWGTTLCREIRTAGRTVAFIVGEYTASTMDVRTEDELFGMNDISAANFSLSLYPNDFFLVTAHSFAPYSMS
jgi:hypothetical protein